MTTAPITCWSFAKWLDPGPDLLQSPNVFMRLPGYASERKPGDSTALTSAIPSLLTEPSPSEWKNELTDLEWKTIGPLWIAVGREILDKDPWFGFIKHSSYIDGSGRFTATFKGKDWYPRYVEELTWRMEEELAFYRSHLARVAQQASTNPKLSDAVWDEDPGAPDGATGDPTADLWLPRIPWKRVADIAVKVWNTERKILLWTPQGWAGNIAWEVGIRGTQWAYREYRQHQRAQERQQRQQQYQHKHNHRYLGADIAIEELDGLLSQDPEVSEYMASLVDLKLHGFFPAASDYAGTWATQTSANLNDLRWRLPGVVHSQDGVYL